MKRMLMAVREMTGEMAARGDHIDLTGIASLIDASIPPPGSPERQRFVLEMADYLAASVMGFTLDPEVVGMRI